MPVSDGKALEPGWGALVHADGCFASCYFFSIVCGDTAGGMGTQFRGSRGKFSLEVELCQVNKLYCDARGRGR